MMRRFFRFLRVTKRDNRGSEFVETVAKIAFIALPLLVAVLLVSRWVLTEADTGGTAVDGQKIDSSAPVSSFGGGGD